MIDLGAPIAEVNGERSLDDKHVTEAGGIEEPLGDNPIFFMPLHQPDLFTPQERPHHKPGRQGNRNIIHHLHPLIIQRQFKIGRHWNWSQETNNSAKAPQVLLNRVIYR